MENSTPSKAEIRLMADRNAIQSEALMQLEKAASLPGAAIAVGLPDLHPGQGIPVGAVIATRDIIYPHLVGNDIGCGISLWPTGIASREIKLERFAKKLAGFDSAPFESPESFLLQHQLAPSGYEKGLGTIGGGNHFAELQVVDKIVDSEGWNKTGLSAEDAVLVIHSGSRSFGQAIRSQHGHATGLHARSDAALAYLNAHNRALQWARANRAAIASRFLERLRSHSNDTAPFLDVSHNLVTSAIIEGEPLWIHRKGAAETGTTPILVPGSRGTPSYLVQPLDQTAASLYSIAHGAGRKWCRSSCREKLEDRFSPESLRRTPLKGLVMCDDVDLLYEEAPQAYKNIDAVIADLTTRNLVKILAVMRPVLTYKTSASNDD